MPVSYPAELRERAVRLVIEARQNPATGDGAITRIAKQLDLLPETVRKWVRRAEIDQGIRPGTTIEDVAQIVTSSYCAVKTRPPSARTKRDAELRTKISRIHAQNYDVYEYGKCMPRSGGRVNVSRNRLCAGR